MEQLSNIKNKLGTLIKQYLQLQQHNVQLKTTVEKQQQTLQQKDKAIENLQKKIDALQLKQAVFSNHDKVVLEKKIDAYLKEIDLCLALINKDE